MEHIACLLECFDGVLQAIFNKRDPIVLGVTVEHGILRTGTLLCVPDKEVRYLENFNLKHSVL